MRNFDELFEAVQSRPVKRVVAAAAAFAPGSVTPRTGSPGKLRLRVGRATAAEVLQATTSIFTPCETRNPAV